MKKLNIIVPLAVALMAAACGSKPKQTAVGPAGAPPDVTKGGAAALDERKIDKNTRKDYMEAVAFYQEQEKAGWNSDSCESAAERFKGVASSHPGLVEARYMAGLSYQHCDKNTEAKEQYEAALKIFKAHAPSLSNLGQIFWDAGEPKLAKDYWEQAVKADPKIAAARANLAWLMIQEMREIGYKDGRWGTIEEQARRHLSSVLAVDNENVEAYVLYGLLYMEGWQKNKNRLDLAKLLLDKGKERNANFPALYNAYGLYYLHRDNVGTALSNFEQAVQLDPTFTEARMNVGNITLGFRKYDTARAQFEAVLEQEPNNYDAIIGLGVAQRGAGDLDGAEASYNKAASIDGKRADAHFNLGVLYKDFKANQASDLKQSQNLYREAKKHFQQFLSKPGIAGQQKQEAENNIQDIDKIVRQIQEVLDVEAQG